MLLSGLVLKHAFSRPCCKTFYNVIIQRFAESKAEATSLCYQCLFVVHKGMKDSLVSYALLGMQFYQCKWTLC